VLALYSKEAGSGSRHAWQTSTSAISALSYLVVQTFEKAASTRFRPIHSCQAKIGVATFRHIASSQFLCRLQEEVDFEDSTVVVGEKDWMVFQKLSTPKCSGVLGSAVKELNAPQKGRKKA
jgi:hypothetical protein